VGSLLIKVIRIASVVICLIVVSSILLFAINRTGAASGHQQEELSGRPSAQSTAASRHESGFRKGVDDAAEELTSPVAGLTSSSTGEWAAQAIRLVFALLLYGFGLGYLARVLRVRT
jgi:hypothetical protein